MTYRSRRARHGQSIDHPPFALSVNDVPIAVVHYDDAIGAAAIAMERFRRLHPSDRTASVTLCRLDLEQRQHLPVLERDTLVHAIERLLAGLTPARAS